MYGALDGVITTLAVISGASGAQLEPRVGLILGLANLFGDGISMGASNYLGLKSELLQAGISSAVEKPWRHGTATLFAFVLFGAVPLFAYAVPRFGRITIFHIALVLAIGALVLLGALRARYVAKRSARSVVEVLVVGFAASGAAYWIGAAAEWVMR